MSGLVLSLFPGIGMLDHGFELEGFCVVRGPDLIWGGDVKTFTPPAGVFDGVIGGPPCQSFSSIGNVNRARYGDQSVMPDCIPEFSRILTAASPRWWLMENSPRAYSPVPGASEFEFDLQWLDHEQSRRRKFWCSHDLRPHIFGEVPALLAPDAGTEPTVSAKEMVDWKGSRQRHGPRTLAEMLRLQGLPTAWMDHQPWTMEAKKKMVGNGVAIPMARALARAISAAADGAA